MPIYIGQLLEIVKDGVKEVDPPQPAYGLHPKNNAITPTSTRDPTLKCLWKMVADTFKRNQERTLP